MKTLAIRRWESASTGRSKAQESCFPIGPSIFTVSAAKYAYAFRSGGLANAIASALFCLMQGGIRRTDQGAGIRHRGCFRHAEVQR